MTMAHTQRPDIRDFSLVTTHFNFYLSSNIPQKPAMGEGWGREKAYGWVLQYGTWGGREAGQEREG